MEPFMVVFAAMLVCVGVGCALGVWLERGARQASESVRQRDRARMVRVAPVDSW